MTSTDYQAIGPRNKTCNLCGGNEFIEGPHGRMTRSGLPPRCAHCGSLERHRIIRQVYDALPEHVLSQARMLHFSEDPAAPRDRFKSVEVSLFGKENSLDITAIDRQDASYDWVVLNHVLEHVQEDLQAVGELLRILTDSGVLQITVPTPATALETWDIENPHDEYWKHYRGYGSDLPLRLADVLNGHFGLQIIASDTATDRWDVVYLFFNRRETMLTLGNALLKAGLPVLRCA